MHDSYVIRAKGKGYKALSVNRELIHGLRYLAPSTEETRPQEVALPILVLLAAIVALWMFVQQSESWTVFSLWVFVILAGSIFSVWRSISTR